MISLTQDDWHKRRAKHEARVRRWTEPRLERAARHECHPVEDFLFTYYSETPGRVRRWHPGVGTALAPPAAGRIPHAEWRWYRTGDDGTVALDPAGYLGIMLDAGFEARAWETTYAQLLPGEDPVLAWVRGTGLRPALQALDAADPSGELTAAFEARYAAALREAYPASTHGTVYPFRRVFAVARRPA